MKCSIEGCYSPSKYKGLCGKHYKRAWRHGDPLQTQFRETKITCLEQNCNRIAKHSNGMCAMHWNRWHRNGSVEKTRNSPGEGGLDTHGYYLLTVEGKRQYQHILVAEKALGKKLPPKAVVHHLNEIKSDNRNMNLVVCPDQAYHMLLHRRAKELGISFQ